MKAIVHIGVPKTGTTTIQSWLAQNQGPLAAQGVYYDRLQQSKKRWWNSHIELSICQFNHAGLLQPNAVMRDTYDYRTLEEQAEVCARYQTFFEAKLKDVSQDTILFSNENIYAQTRSIEVARGLHEWLLQFFDSVEYLVYIRSQTSRIVSQYSQALRLGSDETFASYFERNKVMDYHKGLMMWAKVVGIENLKVRVLDKQILKDGDLIADFADAIGVSPADTVLPPREKESFGVAGAEYLRVLNEYIVAMPPGGKRSNPLRKSIEQLMPAATSADRKLRFSRQQIDAIREANMESNEKIRAQFLPDLTELFPTVPEAGLDDVSANGATAQEMAAFAVALTEALRTRAIGQLSREEVATFRKLQRRKQAAQKNVQPSKMASPKKPAQTAAVAKPGKRAKAVLKT